MKKKIVLAALAVPAICLGSAPSAHASGYSDLYNQTGEYTSCIKAVGVSGPYRCLQAKNHASVASSAAASLYPRSLHNGRGDAFRHCYWNARMTRDFGSSLAYKIATNHEYAVPGPANERAMDLSNNLTGRNVGVKSSSMQNALAMCKWRADTGRLVTL